MPDRSVCLVALSPSEAGPGRLVWYGMVDVCDGYLAAASAARYPSQTSTTDLTPPPPPPPFFFFFFHKKKKRE